MRSLKLPFQVVTLLALGWFAALPAGAQIPQEFTNLQLLPKDIPRSELINTMRGFSQQLGVRCDFCHVGTDQTSAFSDYDFASDEKGHKRITRIMMTMTREINEKHLAEVKMHGQAQVSCATCHHGQPKPSTLDKELMKAFEKGGAGQLVSKYAELREELYGRGVYDFGESSLVAVATTLARDRKDLVAAESVLNLNLEHYPDSFMTWYSLGELRSLAENSTGALEAFRRALEIEPDNEWARKAIERLER